MELLEGETLRTRLGDGPLPASKAAALTLQIAEGLTAAHEKGIVHRDLKPENLFITFDGRVKILDFGLAKQGFEASVDEDGSSSSHVETEARTSPGTILGTAGYMSPEQIRGRECDPRSDLFSLGVTLVEMVSGTRPFSGDTVADTMSAILKDDPKALGNLPPSLERIARRCLEKKPQERFQTARELRAALDAVSDVRDTPPMAATVDRAPSVAVLPFADMSPAKDQEYFCEGIAEELINGLSSVAGLRVAARGSAFQFKGGAQDIRRIGEALNVETVLDGSVRTAGKRLRVTAQLNNAAEGYQLWSKRYDRNLDDVFAVQDEIAADIVRALDTRGEKTDAPRVVRYTENQEAYHL